MSSPAVSSTARLAPAATVGAVALWIVSSRTGVVPSVRLGTSLITVLTRLVATEFAVAAARSGEVSRTEIVMSEVLSGTVAETRVASSRVVVSSSSASITGPSTTCRVATAL